MKNTKPTRKTGAAPAEFSPAEQRAEAIYQGQVIAGYSVWLDYWCLNHMVIDVFVFFSAMIAVFATAFNSLPGVNSIIAGVISLIFLVNMVLSIVIFQLNIWYIETLVHMEIDHPDESRRSFWVTLTSRISYTLWIIGMLLIVCGRHFSPTIFT